MVIIIIALVSVALLVMVALVYGKQVECIELGGEKYALLTGSVKRWGDDPKLRRRFPRVVFIEGCAELDDPPIVDKLDMAVLRDRDITDGTGGLRRELVLELKFCSKWLPHSPWENNSWQLKVGTYILDRLGFVFNDMDKAGGKWWVLGGVLQYCLIERAEQCRRNTNKKTRSLVLEKCLSCTEGRRFVIPYDRGEIESGLRDQMQYWRGEREAIANPSPSKCARCRQGEICSERV